MKRNARGFSLVEMMVALALGLIVVTAVLALVLSIIRSNRQTLQSTRLNQELRATLAVIASDLRRARGVADPLTSALARFRKPLSLDGYGNRPMHHLRIFRRGRRAVAHHRARRRHVVLESVAVMPSPLHAIPTMDWNR
jgi:prepilin-type N-terminal cleavage/methylation domain-containing protein